MSIENPFTNRQITDWEIVEQLYERALGTKYLGIRGSEIGNRSSDMQPILAVEKCMVSDASRETLAELLFEKFGGPALFFGKDAALACYSCGRTSGIVTDVGFSGTTVTTVLDGLVERSTIQASPIGGRYMDAYIHGILANCGVAPTPLFRVIKSLGPDRALTGKNSAQ